MSQKASHLFFSEIHSCINSITLKKKKIFEDGSLLPGTNVKYSIKYFMIPMALWFVEQFCWDSFSQVYILRQHLKCVIDKDRLTWNKCKKKLERVRWCLSNVLWTPKNQPCSRNFLFALGDVSLWVKVWLLSLIVPYLENLHIPGLSVAHAFYCRIVFHCADGPQAICSFA